MTIKRTLHSAGASAARRELVLHYGGSSRAPFGGAREVLAQLGGSAERAIERRRAEVSLILPGLEPRLSIEESAARRRVSGGFLGAFPNVVIRRRRLARAIAECVIDALGGRSATFVVPSIDDIDVMSLGLVRPLLRAAREAGTPIDFAFGEDRSEADGPRSSWLREIARREDVILRALSGAEAGGSIDTTGAPAGAFAHPLDDDRERAPTLGAAEAAFDALGFDVALDRASIALEDPALTAAERRRAHAIAGLSALNLDPLARSPSFAAAAMEEHFTRALDGEPDPLVRSHLRYRLTLVFTRSRAEAPRAIGVADEAVREARSVGDARSRLFEAWARNGRAFALLRAGRAADAADDLDAALRGLEGRDVEDATDPTDVAVARLLVANNRSKVASAAGDREGLRTYRTLVRELGVALAPFDRPSPQWFTPPEDERDLDAHRRFHEVALADARERLDPEGEAESAHALGVLAYRLGDAGGARERFATALRVFDALEREPSDIFTERLNVAVSAYRAGAFDDARRGFEELLRDPMAEGDVAIELDAAMAMIDAARGDRAGMGARAEAAIARAESSEDHGVLARVLRSAAEALLIVGDDDRAASVADRASTLADLAAEDRLAALVTWIDATRGGDRERVAAAIELVPSAVADVNAWWDVPRLVTHASRLGIEGPSMDAAVSIVEQRARARGASSTRGSPGG